MGDARSLAGAAAAGLMGPVLEVAADPEELARRAVRWIASVIGSEPKVPFTLALAGGTTPRRVYELLADESLPFERIAIYFGDERCVPPDDPSSNYRMASEALLDRVGSKRFAAVHRIRGEELDREREAQRYETLVPDVLDLVLLGMGEDGHTASLFPGDPALFETRRKVLAVVGPKPPPERITLSPGAIVAARRILVLAAGSDKAGVAVRALEAPMDVHRVPAQLARTADPGKARQWMLDRAAAEQLNPDWWKP